MATILYPVNSLVALVCEVDIAVGEMIPLVLVKGNVVEEIFEAGNDMGRCWIGKHGCSYSCRCNIIWQMN
eukprot:15343026-Ditylum_brightwellii.AAC.1